MCQVVLEVNEKLTGTLIAFLIDNVLNGMSGVYFNL